MLLPRPLPPCLMPVFAQGLPVRPAQASRLWLPKTCPRSLKSVRVLPIPDPAAGAPRSPRRAMIMKDIVELGLRRPAAGAEAPGATATPVAAPPSAPAPIQSVPHGDAPLAARGDSNLVVFI